MVHFYSLSKDYKRLYELLCAGHTIVGFVDYDRHGDNVEPIRDVVKIVRRREFDIMIGVRGCSYGDVFPYMKKTLSELEVLVSVCTVNNLEWVSGTTNPLDESAKVGA
jgi:hypothetical protein